MLRYDGDTGSFLGQFVPPVLKAFNVPLTCSCTTTSFTSARGPAMFIAMISIPEHSSTSLLKQAAGGLDDPAGTAFGPDGNFYVADLAPSGTKGVLRFDGTTGDFLGEFIPRGSGGLIRPLGIRFGPDGNLYVVNPEGDNVLRYNGTTGAFHRHLCLAKRKAVWIIPPA